MKRNFAFSKSGSLFGITCKTKRALKWVNENVSTESWQWYGPLVFVDIRYADDIVNAIEQEF